MTRRIDRLGLVVGGARCVWNDIRWLEDLVGGPWPGPIIAVNDIATHVPQRHHDDILWDGRIDHWVSLHSRQFPSWKLARWEAGLSRDFETWSHTPGRRTDRILTGRSAGSSGLFATWVGLEGLGLPGVVLVGVPMTRTPHFDESKVHPKGQDWEGADDYLPRWEEQKEELEGRVKSASGNTRMLLGGPTREWLEEGEG